MAKEVKREKRVKIIVNKILNKSAKEKSVPVLFNGRRFEIMYGKEVEVPKPVVNILKETTFPVKYEYYDEKEKIKKYKLVGEKLYHVVVVGETDKDLYKNYKKEDLEELAKKSKSELKEIIDEKEIKIPEIPGFDNMDRVSLAKLILDNSK